MKVEKLKSVLANNRRLMENFSWLAVMQLFIILSPLITYPYLIKVIGLELNGVVVFAQSVTAYLSLMVNFGFNITGAKDVAVSRDNPQAVNQIITAVYVNKFIIWVLLLAIWMALIGTVPFFQKYYWVYFWSFFITVNDLLFPVWLFQGLEKMKFITIINVSTRLLFVLPVFVVVRQASDYYKVSMLLALGSLLGGLLSVYVVFGKLGFRMVRLHGKHLKEKAKEGFTLFLSIVSTQIYGHLSKVLVGTFLGMADVTIYDLCEKIIALIRIPVGILTQTIFPKIARELQLVFINKMKIVAFAMNMAVGVVVFFSLGIVMRYMLHGNYPVMYGIYLILLGVNVIACQGWFYGGGRLVPFGYNRAFTKALFLNACFYAVLATGFALLHIINLYTIPLLSLLTEVFGYILLYSYCSGLGLLKQETARLAKGTQAQ